MAPDEGTQLAGCAGEATPRVAVIGLALAISLVALALCYWRSGILPPPERLDASLFAPPLQTAITKEPFTAVAGGIRYKVIPLYEYDLYGLVVSEHDARAFTDWMHGEASDNLNVIDLCVVWGDDARSGIYRSITFWSGNFTCNFQSADAATFEKFDIFQVSNNHLLTEVPYLKSRLRDVHVGDEVHLHGYLSEYEHDHGFHFHRGTSITRLDTGNGACETVYVTDAQVLRSHNRTWRIGLWLASLGVLCSAFAWLRQPARMLN